MAENFQTVSPCTSVNKTRRRAGAATLRPFTSCYFGLMITVGILIEGAGGGIRIDRIDDRVVARAAVEGAGAVAGVVVGFLSTLRQKGYESTHPVDIRFEARNYKQVHGALRRFPSLGPDKVLKGADASSVVWSVLMEAQKAKGEKIEHEDLDLPGVPEDEAIEELPAMKAADVRGCVKAIAGHVSLDPDDLLEIATYKAGCEARGAALKKEEVEREISRKTRERILPDDKTLEKISRYEAHLSRQLYHALHELENLQKHRTTGKGMPLLRLDVQGGLGGND